MRSFGSLEFEAKQLKLNKQPSNRLFTFLTAPNGYEPLCIIELLGRGAANST